MDIRFSSKAFVRKLAAGVVILTLIHLFFQAGKFVFGHDYAMGLLAMFDLDDEFNIPSIYSFLLYLTAAKYFGWLAYDSSQNRKPFTLHWTGLCIIFVWLGLDEMLMIHEQWTDFIRASLHTRGFLFYAWQIPYFLFLAAILPLYWPLWKPLDKKTRMRVTIAAVLFLTGAVVFESLGGWRYAGIDANKDALYMIFATIEEVLEMSGLIVLIYGILEQARKEIGTVKVAWTE